jgi:salicylate hydroxylase
MLPYLAQGANSAVEDGAVLGLILGHLRSKDQLPKALKMYEDLRKSRGDAIVKETFKQVIIRHRVLVYNHGNTFTDQLYDSATPFTWQMAQIRKRETRSSYRSSANRSFKGPSLANGLVLKFSRGFMAMMLLI